MSAVVSEFDRAKQDLLAIKETLLVFLKKNNCEDLAEALGVATDNLIKAQIKRGEKISYSNQNRDPDVEMLEFASEFLKEAYVSLSSPSYDSDSRNNTIKFFMNSCIESLEKLANSVIAENIELDKERQRKKGRLH